MCGLALPASQSDRLSIRTCLLMKTSEVFIARMKGKGKYKRPVCLTYLEYFIPVILDTNQVWDELTLAVGRAHIFLA